MRLPDKFEATLSHAGELTLSAMRWTTFSYIRTCSSGVKVSSADCQPMNFMSGSMRCTTYNRTFVSQFIRKKRTLCRIEVGVTKLLMTISTAADLANGPMSYFSYFTMEEIHLRLGPRPTADTGLVPFLISNQSQME